MDLATMLDTISQLDSSEIPAILAACAARLAAAKPEPAPRSTPEPDDANLTIEEAAARIRRSTKWIYRHRAALPFIRKIGPRSYIVSRNGLDRWLARRQSL